MFDRFILFACFVTVLTMTAGWAYTVVEAAEMQRFGVTTVEHIAR